MTPQEKALQEKVAQCQVLAATISDQFVRLEDQFRELEFALKQAKAMLTPTIVAKDEE
jgi:hypothetical protein